jgi:hypothetical protein
MFEESLHPRMNLHVLEGLQVAWQRERSLEWP